MLELRIIQRFGMPREAVIGLTWDVRNFCGGYTVVKSFTCEDVNILLEKAKRYNVVPRILRTKAEMRGASKCTK